MPYNLFGEILDKAKKTYTDSSFYKWMESLWSKAYDFANPEQDEIQRFIDDKNIDAQKKRSLLQALNEWEDEKSVRQYISQKYYPEAQFKETLPMAKPLFESTGKEWAISGSLKAIWNLPTSLYNVWAWVANIWSTAIQEWLAPTAKMIGKWLVRQVWAGAEALSKAYQEWGLVWAGTKAIEWAQKVVVQDPTLVFAPKVSMGAWKLAKQWVQATGKGIVKTAEVVVPTIKSIPKAIKKAPWVIDDVIESGVEKLATRAIGSSDGTAELFKATSPSYNVLAKSKDIWKIKQKARLADEAVVDAGFIPKTTTERVDAYKGTMNKLWDDISKARWWVQEKYKSSSIADTIRTEVDRMKVNWKVPPSLESDVNALLKEADFYDNLGDMTLPDLWVTRSNINAKLTFGDKTQYSDAYNAVMKKVITAIKDWEDTVLTRNAWQATSGLLAKYGALRSMLDDVIKQDIKASRAKWLPIEESFGRISGLAEMAGWVGQLVMNPKQAIPSIVSWGSKVLLWKVSWKVKDPDYLIRTWYEKLLQSKKSTNGTPKWNTPVVRPNSIITKNKQTVKPKK